MVARIASGMSSCAATNPGTLKVSRKNAVDTSLRVGQI